MVLLPTTEPVKTSSVNKCATTKTGDTSLGILATQLHHSVANSAHVLFAVGGYKVGRDDKGSLSCFSETAASRAARKSGGNGKTLHVFLLLLFEPTVSPHTHTCCVAP